MQAYNTNHREMNGRSGPERDDQPPEARTIGPTGDNIFTNTASTLWSSVFFVDRPLDRVCIL